MPITDNEKKQLSAILSSSYPASNKKIYELNRFLKEFYNKHNLSLLVLEQLNKQTQKTLLPYLQQINNNHTLSDEYKEAIDDLIRVLEAKQRRVARLFVQPGINSGNLTANTALVKSLLQKGLKVDEIEVVWVNASNIHSRYLQRDTGPRNLSEMNNPDGNKNLEALFAYCKQLKDKLKDVMVTGWSVAEFEKAGTFYKTHGATIKLCDKRKAEISMYGAFDASHEAWMKNMVYISERYASYHLNQVVPKWKQEIDTDEIRLFSAKSEQLLKRKPEEHEYESVDPALMKGFSENSLSKSSSNHSSHQLKLGFYQSAMDLDIASKLRKIAENNAFEVVEWGCSKIDTTSKVKQFLRLNKTQLGHLYQQLDIAVCEGQNTANELLLLGVPVIHVPKSYANMIYPSQNELKHWVKGLNNLNKITKTLDKLKAMSESLQKNQSVLDQLKNFGHDDLANMRLLGQSIRQAPSYRERTYANVVKMVNRETNEFSGDTYTMAMSRERKKRLDDPMPDRLPAQQRKERVSHGNSDVSRMLVLSRKRFKPAHSSTYEQAEAHLKDKPSSLGAPKLV